MLKDYASSCTSSEISCIEKSCGLRITLLAEVTDLTPTGLTPYCLDTLEYKREFEDQLLSMFQTIFVPISAYEKTELPPRWVIILNGHGSQYKTYKDYEIRLIKSAVEFECLVKYLSGEGNPAATILHEVLNKVNTNNLKHISAEEADAWIKKFDEKIVFLKKLANAQAPYRFLKNADIETLPWNA